MANSQSENIKSREPFKFYTRLHLSELTGLKAANLSQLLAVLEKVPGSCIYHHTHRFLQQHEYLSPEPPNDFAYWVSGILGEDRLGEELASIDTIQYSTIRALREKIISTISEYLEKDPLAKLKFSHPEEEFHFIKSLSFILPTTYIVYDLKGFAEVVKNITIDSIYFHMFESRLRLEKGNNDFSYWIESSLGDKQLAQEISQLDPYTHTLDSLRRKLIRIIEKRIGV